ncbi:uncharacterized protein LOC119084391 [Bradysia coprophila]|uniref:uncharacterized protein LOC119084391 n=1 Tax=Bradysia coprophila TaxID=38358 RepID=UPI00187DD850|nr:uncharacterized protein LOC119084391 [Bradysia coprophila]
MMVCVPRQLLSSLVLSYALLHIRSVVPTKHNIIRGEKFLCGTYAPELATVTCNFKRVNRTTEFWSFDGFYSPYFSALNNTDNLFMDVTVYSRQQNLEWRPHMIIHYFVDICGYMNGVLQNKFLDILASDFKKFSNFMHPCPYKGHFYLKNMTFNDEHFPTIVPSAEIYIDFQYFMYVNGSRKRMHYLRPYLEVKTKGILYFK